MSNEKNKRWISGFWRRIGALIVDTILLGVVGVVLGLFFEQYFVELGAWGKVVGFIVAITYFGIFNSKIANGQTLGKKLFNIRVVDSNNESISVLRSIVRYSVIGIPFFLNGAQNASETAFTYWMYILAFVIFGGTLAVFYLYIFNRVTRQSLHDLACGTYVVNTRIEKQEVGHVWKPHLYIVGLLFLFAGVIPFFTANLAEREPFLGMLESQKSLAKHPSVSYVSIWSGASTDTSAKEGAKTISYMIAQALLKQNKISDADLAKQLAISLVESDINSLDKDVIQINLTYGYDIGIANKWSSYSHTFHPNELVGLD